MYNLFDSIGFIFNFGVVVQILKIAYRFKIRLMFYFNLGYSEFSTPVSVVKDLALVLTFLNIVFKINFGWKIDVLACMFVFATFTGVGLILKKSGMSDFANRISNSVNPEIKKINKIAEKLGITDL